MKYFITLVVLMVVFGLFEWLHKKFEKHCLAQKIKARHKVMAAGTAPYVVDAFREWFVHVFDSMAHAVIHASN